ncbi:MAG: hypothetical protein HYY23_08005 [Verrucomicrobia bacterium]|nr:hypothetical protein [Verrucomicrobiota bacterium]
MIAKVHACRSLPILMAAIGALAVDAADVSGTITRDTTWRAAGSPYTVSGNLIIEKDATLAIEPGTTVHAGEGVELTIADGGRLLAEGAATAPIRFTRAPGANARWGGIIIIGGAGSPETRIRFAQIEFNDSTVIRSYGGTVLLDHVDFGTTDRPYVSVDGSSFLISHCHFPSGIEPFELVHGAGGIKAGGRGVVRECFFGSTLGYNDAMDFTGGNRPGPIIQICNNVFTGASDDILDLDGTDAWIEGNIFMHAHRNGAPDSSSAISGGAYGIDTSEITILGNLFFDCDNAVTVKEGNYFTLINNTIVRTTTAGGLDAASGVVCVRDLEPVPSSFGAGVFLEGNIIVDAEQLVRNYEAGQTTVTLINNILPLPWNGPGRGNVVVDPKLKHIPQLGETQFTSWSDAQTLRDWFSLLPGSPAIGAGPNGRDQGGVIPFGVSISGEPSDTTAQTTATLTVGVNRKDSGIPLAGWPGGAGYTHHQWRLDSGPWSAETPIDTPILLLSLADGPHFVEVIGKRDSGWYQNDAELGSDAVITRSRTWVVRSQGHPRITSMRRVRNEFALHFTAQAGITYTVQYKDLVSSPLWLKLANVPAQSAVGEIVVKDSEADGPSRFYRIITPALP